MSRDLAPSSGMRPVRRSPAPARNVRLPMYVEPSLGELFIAHRSKLWSVAQKVVRKPDQADDVLQEAYLKVADAARASAVANPLGYLCQVVRNVAVDFCRRHAVESTYRTYTENGELPEVPGCMAPEQGLDERRLLVAVNCVLARLPVRTRLAFELHRIGGMTQREIGLRLGCSATLVNFMVKDAGEALASWRASSSVGTGLPACPLNRTSRASSTGRTPSPLAVQAGEAEAWL